MPSASDYFDVTLLERFDRKVAETIRLKEELTIHCRNIAAIGRRIEQNERVGDKYALHALINHADKLGECLDRLGVLSGAIAISPVMQSGKKAVVGDDLGGGTATCGCDECKCRRGE